MFGIAVVYANDSVEERAEALTIALADPASSLPATEPSQKNGVLSCRIVPPPAYLNCVPGMRSTRTPNVLVGRTPSRICTVVGSASSGDIHVVDISSLTNPVEVAFFHLPDAGTHNFWMDEQKQVLYAAYYNGGIVALDVSGTLAGDLARREIARLKPGGDGNTYVWGVQLANGSLYASDMLSGLWQIGRVGPSLQ